jgi:hypothetical protein
MAKLSSKAGIAELLDFDGRTVADVLRQVILFGTVSEREAFTYRHGGTPEVRSGTLWGRKDPGELPRWDIWLNAGDIGLGGTAVTESKWYSFFSQSEATNRGNHSGTQGINTIVGLQGALDTLYSNITSRFSGPFGDRPFPAPRDGYRYYASDLGREFQWIEVGSKDLYGNVATAAGYVGLYTLAEIKNLAIGFTNFLPQARVDGLATDFARYDGQTLNARISGFRARALSSASTVTALVEWEGHADKFTLTWAGYSLPLGGQVRGLNTKAMNWGSQTAMLGTSDSMLDGKWLEAAAATLGYTLVNVAKYSSGSKQVYRLGVRPLRFTTAGNTIPAGGTGVQITAINGVAPGPAVSFDAFAAEGFLNTSAGDTIATHCSEAGWLGGRHGIVSVPNAGTPAYTFTPDDGGAATALDPQSLFVPDNLALLQTSEVVIRSTQNTFFAGPGNPVFPNDINPRVLEDIGLIVDATAGQRVTILSLTPGRDFAPGSAIRNALTYFNAQLRALWPQQAAFINGVGTNYDYIRAHGSDGSAEDIADIANGLLPRSCMASSDPTEVHLNVKGQGLERDFFLLWRASQKAPPAVRLGTIFQIDATAKNLRTGLDTTATATATVMGPAIEYAAAAQGMRGEPFETLDAAQFTAILPTGGGVPLVDANGQVIGVVPRKPVDQAQVEALVGDKISADVFEFIVDPLATTPLPLLVDQEGRNVLPRTDAAVTARLASTEANVSALTELVGKGPVRTEVFEQIIVPGTGQRSPLLLDNSGQVVLWSGDDAAAASLAVSIAALSARMDVFHDSGGAPDVQAYQAWRLRKARMKLRMMNLAIANTQLSLTFCGDSYIDDSPKWFRKFADIMFAKYGRAAIGYVGFATSVQLVGWRNALSSNATVVDGTATSPDTYSITSSTSGLLGEWFVSATEPRPTSARLMWNGTSDGVIRYRWFDTDAWKTLNVQGSGVQSALMDLAGMPALNTQIRLRIEVVSGSVELYGVYYANSAGAGIIINKCGNSGTRASGWAAVDQAQQVAALAMIPTDTHCFLLGTNDNSDSRSDVQFAADMVTLFARARLANPPANQVPGCDLLMILPEDIVPHYATKPVGRYTRAMRALAPSIDCAVVSMGYSFGPDPTVYRAWLDDSGFHPHQDTGAYLAADPILQLFSA